MKVQGFLFKSQALCIMLVYLTDPISRILKTDESLQKVELAIT